jgi:hypothetical protein
MPDKGQEHAPKAANPAKGRRHTAKPSTAKARLLAGVAADPAVLVLRTCNADKGSFPMSDPAWGSKPMLDFTQPMTKCERCKKLIVLAAERRNEDSHPFRLAKVPKGVCANCVMTQFLYNTYPINMQIDEAGPELLLKPGICEAFLSSGLLGHSDLNIDEIEWERVVANWDLPVKIQKSGMNPYRMGESPGAEARKAGLPRPSLNWVPPDQDHSFSESGKEQYCPKCGQPTLAPVPPGTKMLSTDLQRHASIFGGFATECQVCGFQSGSIWIRDLPSKAVQ